MHLFGRYLKMVKKIRKTRRCVKRGFVFVRKYKFVKIKFVHRRLWTVTERFGFFFRWKFGQFRSASCKVDWSHPVYLFFVCFIFFLWTTGHDGFISFFSDLQWVGKNTYWMSNNRLSTVAVCNVYSCTVVIFFCRFSISR